METKEKSTRFIVGVLALAGLLLVWTLATAGDLEPNAPPAPTMKTLDEVEPRIPIHASDLPLTITEPNSYYLVEDVNFTDTTNHAITIECDDVTIDLMGYTLNGPNSTSYHGIHINGCTNVEVRNGTVRDFYNGIRGSSSIERNHRVIGVRAISNDGYGIRFYGNGHLIKDCTVAENGGGGISASISSTVTGNTAYNCGAIGINTGAGCTVTGNTARYNASYGISTSTGCTIANNSTYNNDDTGINAGPGSTVTGNTSSQNDGDGVNTDGHGISTSSGTMVFGNTVTYNYGDGINVFHYCTVVDNSCFYNGNGGVGEGIDVTGTNNRIEHNNVTHNDKGILVSSSNNIILKNTARQATNYDIAKGNSYGPIVNVAGIGDISSDPNAAHPWANFAF